MDICRGVEAGSTVQASRVSNQRVLYVALSVFIFCTLYTVLVCHMIVM